MSIYKENIISLTEVGFLDFLEKECKKLKR